MKQYNKGIFFKDNVRPHQTKVKAVMVTAQFELTKTDERYILSRKKDLKTVEVSKDNVFELIADGKKQFNKECLTIKF